MSGSGSALQSSHVTATLLPGDQAEVTVAGRSIHPSRLDAPGLIRPGGPGARVPAVRVIRPRCVPDEGSLTVELVVVTPVLFAMAVVVLIFGRVSESHQQVVSAATAGADAAAVLPDPTTAQAGASIDAAVDVAGQADTCLRSQVTTDVSHFYPGGYVTVTVQCQVGLADVSVPGMPGSMMVRASATAPIDPYRSVG